MKFIFKKLLPTFFAMGVWVSVKPAAADADGPVVVHLALSIGAAGQLGAGISALLLYAGLVKSAVRVDLTLRWIR